MKETTKLSKLMLRGPDDIPDDDIATDEEVDDIIGNIFN